MSLYIQIATSNRFFVIQTKRLRREVYQLSRGLVECVPGRLVLGDVPRGEVGAVGQMRKLAVGGRRLLVGAVLDQQLEDLTSQLEVSRFLKFRNCEP